MPRFAANISTLYAEFAFADRFAAAADDGFAAVEMQFPYAEPAAALAARAADAGVQVVLLNAPAGDWPAERGLAGLPGRESDFRAGFEQALAYAEALDCPRIHVLSGLLPDPGERQRHLETLLSNLDRAAAEAGDRTLLVEPINQRDMPGYLISRQADAHAVVTTLGRDNVKVQLDLYHCQRTEGDLAETLGRDLPTGRVGHLQFAGVPGRHEPDHGELDFGYLFSLIDDLGWDGWVGCEYFPRGNTRAGLAWLARFA